MESRIARKNRKKTLGLGFNTHSLITPKRPIPSTSVKVSFEETRVFVFDFDNTLTPIHVFQQLQANKSVSVEELSEYPYANPEFNESVSELFRFLREKGKTIYIASRNYEDIICNYIRTNFDPEFPLENIYSDRGNYFDQCRWTGKGKFKVFEDNSYRLHELLYIDDSFSDIKEFMERYDGLQYHLKDYLEPLSIKKIQQIFDGTIQEHGTNLLCIGLSDGVSA